MGDPEPKELVPMAIQVTFTIDEDVSVADVKESFEQAFNQTDSPRIWVGQSIEASQVWNVSRNYEITEEVR